MIRLTLASLFTFLIINNSSAQRICGSELPDRYKRIIEIEKQTSDYTNQKLLGRTSHHQIITIPVVVHVLHNGQSVGTGLNISNAQI